MRRGERQDVRHASPPWTLIAILLGAALVAGPNRINDSPSNYGIHSDRGPRSGEGAGAELLPQPRGFERFIRVRESLAADDPAVPDGVQLAMALV